MAATAPDPDQFWDAMDGIDPDEYEAQTRAEGVWPASIPTDPAEREAWKAEYTEDLMRHPGGIDAPWRDGRA